MTTASYELGERIEAVEDVSGDSDELLTVAVPPDEPVGEVLERVEEAHAEAEYIDRDEATRGRRAVLDRAQHLLHGYDETPENGLVLFVGAPEGEHDLVEFAFDDLPHPVAESTYEWDNEFHVDALEAATRAESTYGLLAVERGGAAIGRLRGTEVSVDETIESDVMGKTRAGGQSAQRFERDRDRQKHEFFQEVAAEAERAFLDGDEPAVDGLLVGGTTVTVDEFADGDYLDHRLRDRVVGGTFAVEYASEQGLRRLVEKGRDAVDDTELESVREPLERFRERLHDGHEEVVYGEAAVDRALELGAAETVLVSGDRPADAVREYEERAAAEGGEVVVVPTDTDDGARFDEAFGVGALLRFPVE